MKRTWIAMPLAAAVLFFSAPASAQVSITGVIAGTVLDSTDAVVPGATVSLLDEGTGAKKTAVTNAYGVFAFRDLNFGSYQVTVKLQGFQTALYNKVIVEAGTHDRHARELTVGRPRTEHHGRGQNAGPRDDVQRHFEHAEQQGRQRASARRPQCLHVRASRAGRGRAAGHRQHALQRHAGRHDQSDDRRRQQLVERLQERRHELLRHRAGATRRGRAGDGRDGRPRRRRRRHGRRQPEVRHAARHEQLPAAASSSSTAPTSSTRTRSAT